VRGCTVHTLRINLMFHLLLTDVLSSMKVSYVCVTHVENSGFNVYRSKGRPSQEEVTRMAVPHKMEEEMKALRKELNYDDGTEIVLILSFASDEMIRMVNMFPDVFFMDVTSSTNRQNKPLFLMVVKDANGESHIGNISVLPSEKKWVFNEIFKTVFLELYGEHTIQRNQLMLTDEDTAFYEPIMESIASLPCYEGSEHMLCMFHALAKKFKEIVYPKLPHKKCGKVLDERGEKYGGYYFRHFMLRLFN